MDPTADNSFFSNGGVAPAAQAPPMGFMLRKRLEQVTREKEAAMVRTARLVHAAARLFCCQLCRVVGRSTHRCVLSAVASCAG